MTILPGQLIGGRERDPLRWWGLGEVVRLALPMVLNTVSATLMQFADGLMVSWVSPEALSAQMVGGISAFTVTCFFIGLVGCVSTFAAQHLGAGRPQGAALYGWQGLWLAWAASAALAVLIPPAPALMGLFGHEPAVVRLEATYFRILVAGSALHLTARCLGSWFVGIHRPGVTLAAGVTANLVNLAGNYIFIFGKCGAPALGLAGAGIGTVLGFATEAAILGAAFLGGRTAREFGVRRARRLSWLAMRDLVRVGTPAGAMFAGDLLMWTLFFGRVIGQFGTAAIAATAILNRYWHLCFFPALGVSFAVTAIVGRHCGAGRPRLAWRRAHAGLLLVEAYMLTCGIVIWVARDPLIRVFNEQGDPLVQSLATGTVLFILLCQAFDALNVIFIGALRGAGDTLWPGVVQIALAYGVGLAGSAAVAVLRPDWGLYGPWSVASAYIIVLGLVMWGRFLAGGWQRIRLVEPGPPPAPPEEVSALPPV